MTDIAERNVDLVYAQATRLRTLVGPWRTDRDELIGDGMVALVKARNKWTGPDDEFRNWAAVVVRNAMVDGLRRRWGRNFQRPTDDSIDRRVSDVDTGEEASTVGDLIPDHRSDLEAIVEARERLIELALARPPKPSRSRSDNPLSRQESEALAGAALGESAVETGKRLHRSGETVKTQRSSVMRKLGVRNMTEAVYVAMRDRLSLPV